MESAETAEKFELLEIITDLDKIRWEQPAAEKELSGMEVIERWNFKRINSAFSFIKSIVKNKNERKDESVIFEF